MTNWKILIITALSFSACIGVGITSSLSIVKKPTECEHYDAEKCTDEGICEPTAAECTSEFDQPESCFALWAKNNETGKIKIVLKGCFAHNEQCNQTECISTTQSQKNLFFCCCNGSMCNSDHKWVPTTTDLTETEIPKVETDNDDMKYVIIGCVNFFVLLVICCIGIFFYWRKLHTTLIKEITKTESEMPSSTPCVSLSSIQLVEMKARGRFGTVWHAKMENEDVAVKIFSIHEKQSWITEQEIYKLSKMKHPSILQFIAAEKLTETNQPEFWLITSYHTYGSLCDYLKGHTLSWTELCKIAETMTNGLMYLHGEVITGKTEERNPSIAHRDFKSSNVLLKSDLSACIADFGLAMVFTPEKPCGDIHDQVGTRRYMAPEVLEGAINFTREAFLRIDVYACGLVLWEMMSRCNAHGGIVNEYSLPFEEELGLHPTLDQMQENVVVNRLRPKICDHWRSHPGLSELCDTIEESWDHDAEARLSSSCITERFARYSKYSTTSVLIKSNTITAVNDISNTLV